jgi:hypothetical protein
MATWRIYDNLRATYHDPRAAGGEVQDLGKARDATFEDVLAWAVRQGHPGDVFATSRGCFHFQSEAQA